MAGPAVSGVAALLRQVDANLTVDEMEEILLETANPLTDSQYPSVPNHAYGYGLVDAYEAVSSIITGLGTLEGQVTQQGSDNEAPTFEHTAPAETYAGMALNLSVSVVIILVFPLSYFTTKMQTMHGSKLQLAENPGIINPVNSL